jgi:uncharacterized membrane protein
VTAPQPRPTENWHAVQHDRLTRGEKAADWLRNGMGSWLFVGAFGVVMVAWAVANVVGYAWDPYPFI